MIKPAWYQWAMARQGMAEQPGDAHNPQIVGLWAMAKIALAVKDDEVPWCAAFVNAALEETGYVGTRSGMARSFKPSPKFVECDERVGAIAVLSSSRGPTSGHVAFVHARSDKHLYLIGGNQSNKVMIAPFDRKALLYLLWPASAPDFKLFPEPFQAAGGNIVSDR